jgi:hypothetical protein
MVVLALDSDSHPIDRVRDAIEDTGRRTHGGRWDFRAQCPNEPLEERRLLAHVSVGKRWPVVITCFHGCATDDIRKALGLTWRDLLDDGR